MYLPSNPRSRSLVCLSVCLSFCMGLSVFPTLHTVIYLKINNFFRSCRFVCLSVGPSENLCTIFKISVSLTSFYVSQRIYPLLFSLVIPLIGQLKPDLLNQLGKSYKTSRNWSSFPPLPFLLICPLRLRGEGGGGGMGVISPLRMCVNSWRLPLQNILTFFQE